MVAVPVTPHVLKDVDLVVGTDNYQAHVSQVLFTPASQQQTWTGLDPVSVHSEAGAEQWTCQLNVIQDWDTPDSLARYLFENAGEQVTVTFKPRKSTLPKLTALVTLVSPAIGGAVNTYNESAVTCGVSGRPTFDFDGP